jgi:hypothetical protein
MKFKKVWNAIKNAIAIIEIWNLLKAVLLPSGAITVVTGGGILLPSVNLWLRSFISTYWILFYTFTVFFISVFVLGVRLIIKTHNETNRSKERALLEEKKNIRDKIVVIPAPSIFYHHVHLYVINLSSFDIKIVSIQAIIDGVPPFKDRFVSADQKVINRATLKLITIEPAKIFPEHFVLDPAQMSFKTINGTIFFSICDKEYDFPFTLHLVWRNVDI